MAITKLEKSDIPGLIEIIIEYKKSQNKNYEDHRENIKGLFEKVQDRPDSHVYVYKNDNEKVLGYIGFHILNFPMINGREMYISELLISENARGRGAGKKLLLFAENFAREKGCTRLMLNNGKETETYERDFYKKNGFTERTNCANFIKQL